MALLMAWYVWYMVSAPVRRCIWKAMKNASLHGQLTRSMSVMELQSLFGSGMYFLQKPTYSSSLFSVSAASSKRT